MSNEITLSRTALLDLFRITNELNERVESLELMSDEDFMSSLNKSKLQIKHREFVDWNAL
jgi:hypothetical protein